MLIYRKLFLKKLLKLNKCVPTLKIWCKRHKYYFTQIVADHLKGCGCPKCGKEKNKLGRLSTLDKFTSKSKNIHGDKYGYNYVIYVNSITDVKIYCDKHGIFNQKPVNHLNGSGCPNCTINGFKSDKPATLYVYELLNENKDVGFGYGITNNFKIRNYAHQQTFYHNNITAKLINKFHFVNGLDAENIEKELRKLSEKYKFWC